MLIVEISTLRESPHCGATERDGHHSHRPCGEHLTDTSRKPINGARLSGLAAVTKMLRVTRERVPLSTKAPVYSIAAIRFLRDHFQIDHCEVILHARQAPIRRGGWIESQIELTPCAVETTLAKRPHRPAGTPAESIIMPRNVDPMEVEGLALHAVAGLASRLAGVTAHAPSGTGPRTACPTATGRSRRASERRRRRTERKGTGATQRANEEPMND